MMEPFSSYKNIIAEKICNNENIIIKPKKLNIEKKLINTTEIQTKNTINYYYPIHKHILEITSIPKNKRIHIGIYNIYNNIYLQYLQYLFIKNEDKLDFCFIEIYDETQILNKIQEIVGTTVKIDGYINYNDDYYLLCYLENINYIDTNKYKWCTMYEICNKENNNNYKINKNVKLFFYNNPFLIYLLDKNMVRCKIKKI